MTYQAILDDVDHIQANTIGNDLKPLLSLYESVMGASIWRYDFDENEFKCHNLSYTIENTRQLSTIIRNIKPCFSGYFSQILEAYTEFLLNKNEKILGVPPTLRGFFPIQNSKIAYDYTYLMAIPEMKNGNIAELYLMLMPLKEYRLEPISVFVARGQKKDQFITNEIKSQIELSLSLTKEQGKIFQLISKGYTSNEIAGQLNKKLNNVLKFNIRINSKLSEYFDMPFNNVKEAVNYYMDCFK